jgi:hypothetical protein
MQELQERLAHSEAAAAAYATEHCDAVWLKGQYEGLKGLNAFLQEQLAEQGELLRLQGEELQEMREQQLSADRCVCSLGGGLAGDWLGASSWDEIMGALVD